MYKTNYRASQESNPMKENKIKFLANYNQIKYTIRWMIKMQIIATTELFTSKWLAV